MALITLKGYVKDEFGVGVSGIEVTAWTVDLDGTRGATAALTTYSASTTGAWVLANLNTASSASGMYAVREKNLSTGQIRWREPDIRLMVGYLTGPHGEAPINDGAITAAKLASNSVTSTKISAGAVTTLKIGDKQVTEAKLSDALQTKINSGGGSGGGLTDNSVESRHIVNGSITSNDLGTGSVTSDKLGNSSVTSTKIASGALQSTHFGSSQIAESHLNSALKDKINATSSGGSSQLDTFSTSSTSNVNLTTTASGVLSWTIGAGTWIINWGLNLNAGNTAQTWAGLYQGGVLNGPIAKYSPMNDGISRVSGSVRCIVTSNTQIQIRAWRATSSGFGTASDSYMTGVKVG